MADASVEVDGARDTFFDDEDDATGGVGSMIMRSESSDLVPSSSSVSESITMAAGTAAGVGFLLSLGLDALVEVEGDGAALARREAAGDCLIST